MRKKALIAVSIFSICLFTSACGGNTTDTEAIAIINNTETTTQQSETENISTELEEGLSEPTEQIEVTEETSKIPESESHTSESWPEYSETYDYMAEHTSASMAHMLNPDIYGTETAGKSTGDFTFSLQPDTGEFIKRLELTTTKGYKIVAYWYVEPNTVQFIYTGEVSPYGAWYTDPDSLDVLDAAFNYEKSGLDITHEQKIQILGEPTMTAEEVVEAMKVKYGM